MPDIRTLSQIYIYLLLNDASLKIDYAHDDYRKLADDLDTSLKLHSIVIAIQEHKPLNQKDHQLISHVTSILRRDHISKQNVKQLIHKRLHKDGVRKKKVYISAPFFSKDQIKKVKLVERALNANPTVELVFSPRKHPVTKYKKFTPQWSHACYQLDVKALLHCDATVEITDYDNHDMDSGSAYEMATAKNNHLLVTTISFDDSPINLMIGQASDYHFKDLNDLKHYDFIKQTHNHWHALMH